MEEKRHHYTNTLRWLEGRKGSLEWQEKGKPALTVATPPEFDGGIPGYISPEDLFVAAVNVCTMTTFLNIAHRKRIGLGKFESSARGTLERTESGWRFTRVVVKMRIVVSTDEEVKGAERTAELAHRHCLVANSIKTRVTVETDISVEV